MLNQVVLVGRIAKEFETIEMDNGKKVSKFSLAVPRSYKNIDGEYETDFIEVDLWNGVAEAALEYCRKGDLIAIKGRIQSDTYEKDDEKKHSTKVVAEKLTFLSSKSKTEQETSR